MNKEFNEGWAANAAGWQKSKNPYLPSDPKFHLWLDGWFFYIQHVASTIDAI